MIKRTSGALLLLLAALAHGETKIVSLNGEWTIAKDPGNTGREGKWFAAGPVQGAMRCRVPDVLESTFPDYDGVVWYWKEFDAPGIRASERLQLKFHAADYLAEVWVNGTYAGIHEGGETPFSLDISKLTKVGPGNRLVVRLLNPGNDRIDGMTLNETPHGIKATPMAVGRYWNPGGLWQSVELMTVPAVRVHDLFVTSRLSDGVVTARIAVRNDTASPAKVRLTVAVQPGPRGPSIADTPLALSAKPNGETVTSVEIKVSEPRPWSPDDPYLYRVAARLDGPSGSDERSVRTGFRHFGVKDGHFRLNGKRLFLRGTHAVGHHAIGLHVPHDPELLRRELINAKTMGFNMVRWLGRTMFPSQLDLCDELGLMVYQESYASWLWVDSPKMKERFDLSVREMILRDRNHPSIIAWGLLNEMRNDPIFQYATTMLPLVHSLDGTRLVFLNSGRFDGDLSVGSVANAGVNRWEYEFGLESPSALSDPKLRFRFAYVPGTGDAHRYIGRPWSPEHLAFFRTVGKEGKNVFLSEHGNGSQVNVVRLIRFFEQYGARDDLDDVALYRAIYDQFLRDWKRWGLDRVFASPDEMFDMGERLHSEQRLIALNAIRSNPKLAGYSLTGLVDQAVEGEGLMTTFRELKRGVVDAMVDGFAPVRWSVFAEPIHTYTGSTVQIEGLLANEDTLKPGSYPVRMRVAGPKGVIYDKAQTLTIPDPASRPEPPMVFPVFNEKLTLDGPPGQYEVTVFFERGAAAVGRQTLIAGDRSSIPRTPVEVTVLETGNQMATWLQERGATVRQFSSGGVASPREIILVGSTSRGEEIKAVMDRVTKGGLAVFLAPASLGRDKDALAYLPLAGKGSLVESAGMYWGRDDIVTPHPVFDGLPSRTLMDLTFYRDVVATHSYVDFEGAEVLTPTFALGRPGGKGYWAGANLLVHQTGKGKVLLSTLRLLEHLGRHPAADRILTNMIGWAARETGKE